MNVQLCCSDFDSALGYYTEELGFRLDLIYPADSPRIAELSGYGVDVRLERLADEVSANDGEWVTGRAGMQYRDLIPDRLGGKVIASHIRIPNGGPVPDYVHHHGVEFQMIYCYRGWVRVVYEDQGPPFVLEAGDCVLQPPHIRHRVLECSDQMEVVEVGSPAEHETRVEHEIDLPTSGLDCDRDFGGQRFVRHQAAQADWVSGPFDGFESRDTGIGDATNGLASVLVTRPQLKEQGASIDCDTGYVFMFVLQGTMTSRMGGEVESVSNAGGAVVVAAGSSAEISNSSSDLEILLIRSS